MTVRSNLRSGAPAQTKLAILDTKSMVLRGYDGRYHCQTVKLEVDESTVPEELISAIDEFRLASDEVETRKNEEAARVAEHESRARKRADLARQTALAKLTLEDKAALGIIDA